MTLTTTPQRSLMLVEDSEDDAFFFHRTFQKVNSDFSLNHVLNGSLAVESLKKAFAAGNLPAIIFLDLKMPLMNGFDVLAWIKK
jgi:CheY-like chemotaxis protein